MADIDDGGPAFPVSDVGVHGTFGLTLRDYFAAQALSGYLSIEGVVTLPPDELKKIASGCYEWADEMLAARKKGPGK